MVKAIETFFIIPKVASIAHCSYINTSVLGLGGINVLLEEQSFQLEI
jgi:hypothetical protein